MSRVAKVELFHVAIPLPATFRPAWIPGMPSNENRFTLVRVTTDEGVEGYSAGPAIGRERAGLGDLLGPYLLGEDATDIALIQQRLREISYLGWRNWWIEPAFWDIKGKIEGKPVYELLGGAACSVRLYASTGEVKEPEARIEEAEARYAEGFSTVKLRVHDFDEAIDIRQVTATAQAVGNRMKIAVDANQGWRVTIVGDSPLWDLERAKRFADACADVGVVWIEEPIAMDAYENLSSLTEYSRVPIAGGELNSSGLPELKTMIERRCYDIFQPDAVFTGGIAQTWQVIQLLQKHDLSYAPHTWTNGIGFAVNLQLFAASGFAETRELEYPLAPPGWTVAARDGILEDPFDHNHGVLETPTSPGLGFTIDRKALARWGKRFSIMDRKRLIWFSLRHRGINASKEIDRARRQRMGRA
ncbi:MAG: mandelate racemase/muconate lactonizing enzyme family protein [bacterium]|nr:mandelate racemase/muconate lactonizing enzyme family protein [bacterium]